LDHASRRAKRVAEITGHIGKWYTLVPLTLVAAVPLARRRRLAAAATLPMSAVAATTASSVLDHLHDHRTPPPGKGDPSAQSFPSGHALETTAVAITASWIAAREDAVSPAITAPVAAIASAISGLGRLALDRHWTTDSAAGYLAGIALGTACAGAYELARR
jgi:membrane-associated phospholipid phosphatase